MIKSLHIRNDINALPLYFSQVREDPALDVEVIKSVGCPCKVLMIASGGDTVCRLATLKEVSSIDAVDANVAQLSLNKFKLSLLKFSPENRLRILGHEAMDSDIRLQIVNEICRELKIKLSDFGPEEMVAQLGPDFTGRYEQLFLGIQTELNSRGIKLGDLYNDPSILDEHFEDYFDLDLLVRIFGKEATQNPLKAFSKHFLDQTQAFLSNSQNLHSPFIHQMLSGKFGSDVYEWMKASALKESEIKQVTFHQKMMLNFLIQAKDNSYDFIHLSNILDWLSEEDASYLLRQTHRALRRGGKVIIRQLNSSLDIMKLGEGIHWDRSLSHDLTKMDQSFFYREVLVGNKLA